jgi:hypothetical protein
MTGWTPFLGSLKNKECQQQCILFDISTEMVTQSRKIVMMMLISLTYLLTAPSLDFISSFLTRGDGDMSMAQEQQSRVWNRFHEGLPIPLQQGNNDVGSLLLLEDVQTESISVMDPESKERSN